MSDEIRRKTFKVGPDHFKAFGNSGRLVDETGEYIDLNVAFNKILAGLILRKGDEIEIIAKVHKK